MTRRFLQRREQRIGAIADAVRLLFFRMKLVAEPSGAVALAALASRAVERAGKVGVIISGGNVDAAVMRTLLDSAAVARWTLRATMPRLDRILARAGFGEIDLLFMEPGAPMTALLDRFPRARWVYRMCDDTSAFPDTPRSFAAIERDVLERADLVLATARPLVERARAAGARRVLYLPNACEPQRFAAPARPDRGLAGSSRTVD